LASKVISDSSDHGDEGIDCGTRFELELNGFNEILTEFTISELFKDIIKLHGKSGACNTG
jgi:hypothetical protein